MGTASPRTRATKDPERGCLGYIGDDILPSYIGIVINHEIRIPIEIIKQPA